MVEAKQFPLEDSATIKWFNQMMEEQQAYYCYEAARQLQEDADPHSIWDYDATN